VSAGKSSILSADVDTIVSSPSKRQLVLAAAGSGKTQLLVDVLARRIRDGRIDPSVDRVVVFTFTNNASDELVVRLSSILGSGQQRDSLNRIFVGTIHGWCNQYLVETGMLSNSKVIDELERAQLIQRVYIALGLHDLYSGRTPFERIDKFLKDLEFFYNESLHISDSIIPNNVRVAITNYLNFIGGQRLTDFGLLIREAIERLSNDDNKQASYHVYVDEYQDVNPAQVRLLQTLVGRSEESSLFAVGDPRQAIYQWRGSDLGRILEFRNDFPNSEIYGKNTNRRSRTGIVKFANIVAQNMSFPAHMSIDDMTDAPNRRDESASVLIDNSSSPNEEAVVKQVRDLIDQGARPSDIAILLRSVLNHGPQLMAEMERQNIPFYSPNRNAGTEFVCNFMNSVICLVQYAHDPPVPGNREEEKEIENQVHNWLSRIQAYCGQKDLQRIHIAISNWHRELVRDTSRPRNERYNFRQQLFDFCKEVDLVIDPSQPDLQEGLSAVTQVMRAVEEAYRRRLLHGFNERASPYAVFVHNLGWQLNHELERWTEVGMGARKSGVTISTIHAAKGLEWPVVIIPGAWQGRFPLKSSGHGTSFADKVAERYGTTVEDERRLWYVAITRPRDRLYVFSGGGKHPISPFVHIDSLDRHEKTIRVGLTPFVDIPLSKIESHSRPFYLHVGVSDLLLLLECPYHFYLRRVAGVDVPVGEELGAGNIIHRVVQRTAEETPSSIDAILDEEVYLPLGEIAHEKRMKNSIKKRVERLISSGILEGTDLTEHRFSTQIGNVVVSGIVDATRKTKENVELVDWKYSVHEEYRSRYENQLKVYAYSLRTLGMEISSAILYDLSQPTKHPTEIEVDVSPSEGEKTMTDALKLFRDLTEKGPSTRPGKSVCVICDVSAVCPDRVTEKTPKSRYR